MTLIMLTGEYWLVKEIESFIHAHPQLSMGPKFTDKPEPDQKHLNNFSLNDIQPKPDYWLNLLGTRVFDPEYLTMTRRGCFNLHPGKLPSYGGFFAYQWAIRNGEKTTAATLQRMEEKIDGGDIIDEAVVEILPSDTGLSVYRNICKAGIKITKTFLETISKGESVQSVPITGPVRLWKKKEIGDGLIDLTQTAEQVHNFIRAADFRPLRSPIYEPYFMQNGHKIRVTHSEMNPPLISRPENALDILCGDEKKIRLFLAH